MAASTGRIVAVGLGAGLFFNILGWLGNNLLLGADWDSASALATNAVTLPYPRLVREIVSLVPDFLFGLTMAWFYSRTVDRTPIGTFKFVLVYWLATVGVLYLAIVNSKLLPWQVCVKTSLLALILFLPAVWLLPRYIPPANEA